jgi:hypothetical protein
MTKNKSRLILLLATGLLFSVYAQAQTIGPVELKKDGRSSGGFAETKMKKAPKKVYIAQFRIMYQLLYSVSESTDGGRTLGGGYKGGTSADVTVAIPSVTKEDLVETTNKIYNEYLDGLKKQGYEILEADAAAGSKEFAEWTKVKGGGLNEAQFKGYIMSTPTDFEYFVKKTTASGKEKSSFIDNSAKLSADLGGAIVIKVNLLIPFMSDAESQGSKALTGAVGGVSKIVLAPDFRLTNEGVTAGGFSSDMGTTKVSYYFAEKRTAPDAVAFSILKNPIQISGVFEDKKYKAVSTADVNQNWEGAAIIVIENRSTSNIQKADCDPKMYKDGIYNASTQFLNASLGQLSSYTSGK